MDTEDPRFLFVYFFFLHLFKGRFSKLLFWGVFGEAFSSLDCAAVSWGTLRQFESFMAMQVLRSSAMYTTESCYNGHSRSKVNFLGSSHERNSIQLLKKFSKVFGLSFELLRYKEHVFVVEYEVLDRCTWLVLYGYSIKKNCNRFRIIFQMFEGEREARILN